MASTDTGHEGQDRDYTRQPEALLDYAYRGVHLATGAAKRVIQKYYGREIDRAYLKGCSNGGRAAMLEATRFPDDYDGILAGAPAFRFQEERAPCRVSNIRVGTGFEEGLRSVEGLLHHRVHQRRGAFVIDLVEVGAGFKKQADQVRMRSVVKGCSTAPVRHVDIGRSRADQGGENMRVGPGRGQVQWRPALVIYGANVGAGLDQVANDLEACTSWELQHTMQDAVALLPPRVDVGPGFEENRHDVLGEVVPDCVEQRRVAFVIPRMDVRTSVKQNPDDVCSAAPPGCVVQWCAVPAARVDIGALEALRFPTGGSSVAGCAQAGTARTRPAATNPRARIDMAVPPP